MGSEKAGVCAADESGKHALCGCGNQPPIHCMWSCNDLNADEIHDCIAHGDSINPEVLERQGLHKLAEELRKSGKNEPS